MFGFVSRATSSIRSPKALLTHSLASALSEFFHVDPDLIVANLLQDTKIVLHDIQLKPQYYENSCLEGHVEDIQFTWIWGGDSQTAFIRETRLEIRGAHFRLVLNKNDKGEGDSGFNNTEQPDEPTQQQQENMTYLQRQVQQVVDHLTLSMTDMELIMESAHDAQQKIVLEATDLCLLSFGRNQSAQPSEAEAAPPPLSQQISLGSFRAFLLDKASRATLPLVDPIGYAASVKRTSGKRFMDGISRGLEIVGESVENGIVVHAGTTQLQVFGAMMELLLPGSKSRNHTARPESAPEQDYNKSSQDEVFVDAKENLDDCFNDEETQSASPSTSFVLPLPSVTVILPNESRVSTPDCTFHYSVDGSVCKLQGSHGILINEEFRLVHFLDHAEWLVDFCETKVSLSNGRRRDKEALADVVWCENEMKRLLRGFYKILESTSRSVVEKVEDTIHDQTPRPHQANTSPWSVDIDGSIHLRLEGDDEEWIEATVDSPSVVLSSGATVDSPSVVLSSGESSGLPSKFNVSGITLGPTSFGEASVQVPAITLSKEEIFCVEGAIKASLESATVAEKLQSFLTRVMDVDSCPVDDTPTDTPISFPFPVHLPQVRLMVSEPEIHIVADDIELYNSTIECKVAQLSEGSGMSASVSGVAVEIDRDITMRLCQIEALHIPGVLDLASPLHEAALCYADGALLVKMESASVRAAHAPKSTKETEDSNITLPFPVQLQLNELKLSISENTDAFVELRKLDITAASIGEAISIDSRDTIAVRVTSRQEWLDATLAPSTICLGSSCGIYSISSFKSSGIQIGPSSFGILSLSIPSVSLESPIDSIHVNGTVNLTSVSPTIFDDIQRLLHDVFWLEDSTDSSVCSPYPICVREARLSLEEPAISVEMKKISIHDSIVQCQSIKCVEASGMAGSVSDVSANLKSPIEMTAARIESLLIPGTVRLAEPVSGTSMTYKDGILQILLASMEAITPLIGGDGAAERSKASNGQSGASLPVPVTISLDEMRLRSSMESAASISLQSICLVLSPIEELVSVESRGKIAARVAASETEWLDVSIAAFKASLSPSDGYSLSSGSVTDIRAGPSSFGNVSMHVPLVSLTPATGVVEVVGVLEASLHSQAVLENIQTLLQDVFGFGGNSKTTDPVSFPYPIAVQEARLSLEEPAISVEMKKISIHDSIVQCQSIKCVEASGMAGSVSDVSANLATPVEVTVSTIESLVVPGIVSLAEPIANSSLAFVEGVLQIDLKCVDLITPLMTGHPPGEASIGRSGKGDFGLPCPIYIHIRELKVWSSADISCSVRVKPIDVVVASVDTIFSIDVGGLMAVCVSSSSDESVEMILGASSAVLSPSHDGYCFDSLNCASIQIEPSPVFPMSLSIPAFSKKDNEVSVEGAVQVSIQSIAIAGRVQTLFARCFPSATAEDSSADYSTLSKVMLPEMKLSITDIGAHLSVENIKVNERDVFCERILVNDENGTAVALSGVQGNMLPEPTIGVEWIESFYIPGVCSLQKPCQCTTLAFIGGSLRANMGSMSVMCLATNGAKESRPTEETKHAIEIPYPIRVSLKELILHFPVSQVDGDSTTFLRNIELDVKATEVDRFATVKGPQGIALYIAVNQVDNRLLKVDTMRASGTIYNGRTDIVHRFAFAAKTAIVVAGFSSLDWSNTFRNGEEQENVPTLLPFASIEPFKAHLAYEGSLVGTRMTVDVPLFQGSQNTTSDHLIKHLTNSILTKAPSIITNSEFLGENIVEMSTKSGGRALMASTVAGSAVGSVGGLVAVDSIRGAINSGKKGRNASSSDRYHVGDVSRGLVRSVGQAAKAGGRVRRGYTDSYRVGDFSVGASRSACSYASENKSRLSAASGSGVGMAIGAAVAGPLGFVAGGYIGSKLGGSVFEEDGVKPTEPVASSTTEMDKEAVVSRQITSEKTAPTAPMSSSEEDLLGLNTSAASVGQSVSSSYMNAKVASDPKRTSFQPVPTAGGDVDLLGLGISYDSTPPARSSMQPTNSHPLASPPATTHAPSPANVPPVRNQPQQISSHQVHNKRAPAVCRPPPPPQQTEKDQGYRFGDVTKSLVARGKRKDGRSESEGYKFGDFTRGLFG